MSLKAHIYQRYPNIDALLAASTEFGKYGKLRRNTDDTLFAYEEQVYKITTCGDIIDKDSLHKWLKKKTTCPKCGIDLSHTLPQKQVKNTLPS